MRAKRILASIAVTGTLLFAARSAAAQFGRAEPREFRPQVVAPRRAVEIAFGTGFVQGFGRTGSDKVPYLSDFAREGVGFQTELGFRFTPSLSLAATFGYAAYQPGDSTGAADAPQGVSAGIDATWYVQPTQYVHPYLQLGTGYRFLWNGGRVEGQDFALHGFELAKLGLGLEVQAARYFAIGPKVALAFDVFLWDTAEARRWSSLDQPRVNPYVSAGLQARFDIPVTRSRSRTVASY